MEKDWWKKSVVYQIYPKSFYDSNGDGIGDLRGIVRKLPYIQKLGADVIWLCPVYESPQVDNGYDISDYYKISKLYGSIADMEALIEKSKSLGIKIIMDLVVNHTSDQHPWFHEARKSKDNPYRDFYIWRDEPNDLQSGFGGPAWTFDETAKQYYLHLFSKEQPDLNWENPKLRREIWKMMNYWLDKGISGFRMDVIDLLGKVPDQKITGNGPRLHEFLQEMHRETFGHSNTMTVGETWGATVDNAHLFTDASRGELDMVFQFEHIELDKQPGGHKWDLKELNLADLKAVFSKWQDTFAKDGWNSLFWNNHDLPRIVSRWGNDGPYREQSAKMLATLLHGLKGTPYIYQGEEIGMTNLKSSSIADYPDIETQNMYRERMANGYPEKDIMASVQKKARDHARTPMQWDASRNAGFTEGEPWMKVNPNYAEVNVEEQLNREDSVFYHYQKLIRLRKDHPIFTEGAYTLVDKENPQVFAYKRVLGSQILLVVCNFYGKPAVFRYAAETPQNVNILLSNYKNSPADLHDLQLRPYEAVVYQF